MFLSALSFLIMLVTLSIQGSVVTTRALSDALDEKGKEKIVYVGIGSASSTDTYQAYPLFMELLSVQYPGVCKSINFDISWENRLSTDKEGSFQQTLLKRDPKLSAQNFFIINTNLTRSINAKLYPYLKNILIQGGVVILGKFTHYPEAMELQLLYTQLLQEVPDRKNSLLFFSQVSDTKRIVWWQNNYSLYADMIAGEQFDIMEKGSPDEHYKLRLRLAEKYWKERLDDTEKKILPYTPVTEKQFLVAINTESLLYPQRALENTASLVINVIRSDADIFSISNVYFLGQLFQELNRSLHLIHLLALPS